MRSTAIELCRQALDDQIAHQRPVDPGRERRAWCDGVILSAVVQHQPVERVYRTVREQRVVELPRAVFLTEIEPEGLLVELPAASAMDADPGGKREACLAVALYVSDLRRAFPVEAMLERIGIDAALGVPEVGRIDDEGEERERGGEGEEVGGGDGGAQVAIGEERTGTQDDDGRCGSGERQRPGVEGGGVRSRERAIEGEEDPGVRLWCV